MRRLLFFSLLLLAAFSSCKKKQEDLLEDIKKSCTEIDAKLKEYKLVRVEDNTLSGETVKGYYNDNEVRKVVAEDFTDTCRTFTNYYFDNGSVVYIYKESYVYNRPMSDTLGYDDKKTRLETNVFYFDDNKLIKWTGPGKKEMMTKTRAFVIKEEELWGETVLLLRELKEQKEKQK